MGRAIKLISVLVLAVAALLASAVFIVTRLIDPNDFKPQIQQAARDSAGLDLDIQGQLGWTFWPSLGVSSGRVEVRLADDSELFAALDSAAVSVSVWPLLMGNVEVDGLTLAGLDINLVENEDGANWERIGANTASEESSGAEDADTGSGSSLPPISIPSLAIVNSQLRYRSSLDGTDLTIDGLEVQATEVSLDKAFPLSFGMNYSDQSGMTLRLDSQAQVRADVDNEQYSLANLVADLAVTGATTKPLTARIAGGLAADMGTDSASIMDLVIELAPAQLSANLEISQLSTAPVIAGRISSNSFDVNALMATLGEAAIETSDPSALSSVVMDITLKGPANSVMADPLVITLDSSKLSGKAGLSDINTGALVFDLALDRIRLDGYLPPDAATETASEPAAASGQSIQESEALLPPLSAEPLLPLADLRTLIVDGKLRVGAVQYQDIGINELQLAVSARDGVLALTQLAGKGLQGSFAADATLDARTDTPIMTASTSIKGMQVQPLAKAALDDDLFLGILDLDMNVEARGNSEQALADTSRGAITTTLTKGTLRGMNLHTTLLKGINDMLGAYQALTSFAPDVDPNRLPAELREDTEVVQLLAKARLEKLMVFADSIEAQLRDGTLSGNGVMSLRSALFDFRLGMTSEKITDNKYLKGQTWPMRCKGSLNGDAADWCRQDKEGFKDIGKSVASKVAQDKVKEKLGIEGEGDTAEEVVKDAAEKKAKEEINKQLNEGLKKLFR